MPRSPHRFALSIRNKLFLVSLSLLIIPWLGYRYIQDMSDYLRDNREQALLERARIIAAALHDREHLFYSSGGDRVGNTAGHLYVRPLQAPMTLDGYADDWQLYRERQQTLTAHRNGTSSEPHDAPSLNATFMLGSYAGDLFILFEVSDDDVMYRQPNDPVGTLNDHLHISYEGPGGTIARHRLSTSAPGWVTVERLTLDGTASTKSIPISPIKAEWQEHPSGYNVEVSIPISEIGARLGFSVIDVDDDQREHRPSTVATIHPAHEGELGTIIVPSPEVGALLKRLEIASSRTWVVDENYRVIALTGRFNPQRPGLDEIPERNSIPDEKLQATALSAVTRIFYNLILRQPATEFQDDRFSASRLDSEEMKLALNGQAATRWRQTPDNRVNILTAAYPIKSGKRVIGAVALEETSNSILLLQNRAMEILINLSILAFLIATTILLAFASRLSWRIRRLRNDAESAVSSDGKVRGSISASAASDEIGDLSRSFSDMVSRLNDYNRYLESMASKLSHEIRTPLTVIRSSLDNLSSAELNTSTHTYVDRARDGLLRLNNILTRMSEATRLEQTLQQEQRDKFDLNEVVAGCVAGYKLAYPHQTFILDIDESSTPEPTTVDGAPDLIAQLLDKLVSNAVEFCEKNTSIVISLRAKDGRAKLCVVNEGPPLPDEMQQSLFNSMVSIRNRKSDDPHLGLGLYIVRLITEFHNGTVSAYNLDSKSGVTFCVTLPRVA